MIYFKRKYHFENYETIDWQTRFIQSIDMYAVQYNYYNSNNNNAMSYTTVSGII